MAHEGRKVPDIEGFLKALGATATDVRVFLALVGARKYIGVRELSALTGLSEKGVRNSLRRLEEKGLVRVKEEGNKKVYRPVHIKEIVEMWKRELERKFSHLFSRP